MITIHLQPAEAWDFFKEHKVRLATELMEIATNDATKVAVFITEEDDKPYLYVYRDDKKVFESACQTAYETERNLRIILATYVKGEPIPADLDKNTTTSAAVDDDDDPDTPPFTDDIEAMTLEEFNEYADEREGVIICAIMSMIETLTEDDEGVIEDESLADIVDDIVEYLAIKHGLRIRRPMIVYDETAKKDVRTEYPYNEYEFEGGDLDE